jgi:hypothetical protein
METMKIKTGIVSEEDASRVNLSHVRWGMNFRENTYNRRPRPPRRDRRGVASLDYMLVIAVVLPIAGFIMWRGSRMMNLVYEMTAVLISWPFL